MAVIVVQLILRIVQTTPVEEAVPFVSTVDEIGRLLITDHILAFELSSVLLLGALVGAAMISRPKKTLIPNEKAKEETHG